MFDIITFGSSVVDIFVDTDLREKGKFMVYPVGSKILIKNMTFNIGGGGTNTAVAFSRFGLKTGYIGRVGKDFGGEQILDLLKKEKIEFFGKVETNSQVIGGYSIVLDSKENDRTILTYKGINDEIRLSDIKLNEIQTKWLYFSSLLGNSFKTQEKLATLLHHKGVKIAFNPSEYLIKKENLKSILKLCEILILNKEEAELLTKEKDLLLGLRKLGPKIVVITNRDKEVLAYDGSNKYSIIPHKLKVVERTGAGDAFASGFVAGQISGKSIKDSLKLGLEESESVIEHKGAKIGLLKRKLK
jgi:ribokinase